MQALNNQIQPERNNQIQQSLALRRQAMPTQTQSQVQRTAPPAPASSPVDSSMTTEDEDEESNDSGTQSILSGLSSMSPDDESSEESSQYAGAASCAATSQDAGTASCASTLTPSEDAADDKAYWAEQPAAVQALQNISNPTQRAAQAEQLASEGYKIDNAIDVWGWDPEKTMQARQQDGYTWVPSANQPNIAIAPGLSQPGVQPYNPNDPPPGSIAVQTNFTNPAATAQSTSTSTTNPVSSMTSSPTTATAPATSTTASSTSGSGNSTANQNPAPGTPYYDLSPTQDAAEDAAYWKAQPAAVQALQNITNPTQRQAAAEQLASEGYTIDNAIDVWGWDPEKTMMMRQQDGYTWTPSGNQPNIAIAPGLSMPGVASYNPNAPPPGSIAVNTDWLS